MTITKAHHKPLAPAFPTCTRAMMRMLAAAAFAATGSVSSLSAQTIEWTSDFSAEGVVEVEPGSGDTRSSRQAVLGAGGMTWVAGRTDTGDDDFVLLKFDSTGNRLLSRTIDLGGSDSGGNLLPAPEGGVYATATSRAPLGGATTILLLKFDADGELVWRQSFTAPSSRSLSFRGQFVRSGGDLYLLWTSSDSADDKSRIALARITDDGERPVLQWTSEVLATTDDLLNNPWFGIDAAGTRLAVVSEISPPLDSDELFLAIVDTSTGLIEATTTTDDDIGGGAGLVPPVLGSDGVIRVAIRSTGSSLGVLRFDSNATRLGAAFRACTGVCAVSDLHVDPDGNAYVAGRDQLSTGEVTAVLMRFTAAGPLDWEREIFPNTEGVALAEDADGIAMALTARPDPADPSTRAFVLARIDETGNLIDPPGFAVIDSGTAELVAARRDAQGVFHLLGSSQSEGSLAVSQFSFDEAEARFVTDQGVGATPLSNFPGPSVLALDSLNRPLLVLGGDLAAGQISGLIAAGFDGVEQWRRETAPLVDESEARATVTGTGEVRLYTLAGGFSNRQLTQRRIDEASGADLGPIQSFGAPAATGLRVDGDGQGNSVTAVRELDFDANTLDILVHYFDASGAPVWQATIPDVQGSFFRDQEIVMLGDGDPVSVHTDNDTGGLVALRLDQTDGSITAGPALPVPIGVVQQAPVAVRVEGEQVYVGGIETATAMDGSTVLAAFVACLDLATNEVCWIWRDTVGAGSVSQGLALDPASSTLYLAGTREPSTADERAFVVALDAETGAFGWLRALDGPLATRGVGVVVHDDQPVLAAGQADAGYQRRTGVRFARLAAGGALLRDVFLESPARFDALAVVHPAASDRAYVFGESASEGGPATGRLLAINLADPELRVLPGRLDFGEVALGQTSAPQMAVIENNGAGNLDLDNLAQTGPQAGDFSLVAENCSFTRLQTGQACGFEIEFTPQAGGVRRAELRIPSNDPAGPHAVELIGTHDVLFFDGFEALP